MTVNRDQLFADLEALTEDQIEAGLEAGVWSEMNRPLVQRHLNKMRLQRAEAVAAEQLDVARDAQQAALTAVVEARGAKLRSSAALIIAVGAMVAAMLGTFVAFLAMRGFRAEALW